MSNKKGNVIIGLTMILIIVGIVSLGLYLFMGEKLRTKWHQPTSQQANSSPPQGPTQADEATPHEAAIEANSSAQDAPKAITKLEAPKASKSINQFTAKVIAEAFAETEESAFIKTNVGEIQLYLIGLDEQSMDHLFYAKSGQCLLFNSKEPVTIPSPQLLLFQNYTIKKTACP